MTFDQERCASIPFALPYQPDQFPGSTVWDPRAFWLNFNDTSQVDSSHSLNYVSCNIGSGKHSSTVSPTRSQGGTILTEFFANLSRWRSPYGQLIATGSGSPHIAQAGDPVTTGFVLSTNGTLGSVAGGTCALGTVPASFSYATLFNTLVVGSNPADALHIWVQNNAGVTLQTRYYNGICEVYANGAWHLLGTIGNLGTDSECWVECGNNGNGTHTVKLYGGCQLYGTYTGVLQTGQLTNNQAFVSQQSGATANRVSIIDELNVGPTQLPDNMTMCTPAFSTLVSPTNGNLSFYFEDVSRDLVANSNICAYITKAGLAPWVQVPLIDVGASVFKGELDVTADVRRFIGSVAFPAGSGTIIRANITSSSGAFPVLQGLTAFWD